MPSDRITVLVTGVGGGGHGEQVLKALLLAGNRYRIIGTDMSARSYGLSVVERGYLVPPAAHRDYLCRLLDICKKEQVAVLVTGSEPELMRVSEAREIFEARGIICLLNTRAVIELCQDKWRTVTFLQHQGFPCPRSVLAGDDGVLDAVDFLPAVVKPARGGGGSAHTYLAMDREDLRFFIRYLRKQGLLPLVQEYVGSHEQEFTVGVLSGQAGEILGSFALQRDMGSSLSCRLRARATVAPGEAGVLAISSGISQGSVGDFADLRHAAEAIATRLGSRGPLNVQCRRTPGGVVPFEVNPRFSGTTSIRAMLGFNEPDLLIRHRLFGDRPSVRSPRDGVVVRSLLERYLSEEWMAALTSGTTVANDPHEATTKLGLQRPEVEGKS